MSHVRLVRSSVCLLVITGALWPAAHAQSPWYLGASAGQSAIRADPGEIESGFLVDDAFTATGTTLDKRDSGWKLYAGHRFHRFLAVEFGYIDLGEASFNTTIVAAPAGTVPAPPFPIHATATARGAFLSAVAQWPVSSIFTVFGKLGAFRSEAEFTEVITTTGVTRVSRTERRTDVTAGLGLEWNITNALAARLELERFKDVGRGIGGRQGRDVDFASIGVVVRF